MYSAYKLNKQGDSVQPGHTPFPILNQPIVPCPFLTGKKLWYSHLFKNFPQFVVIYTIKGFGIVDKAEVDVLLEFFCFSMIQQLLSI